MYANKLVQVATYKLRRRAKPSLVQWINGSTTNHRTVLQFKSTQHRTDLLNLMPLTCKVDSKRIVVLNGKKPSCCCIDGGGSLFLGQQWHAAQ